MSKILVVDDDPDIATVVKLILKRYGYDSEYVSDYRYVNEKIATYSPNLLIMDVSLGGADGRKICKQLKENKESCHIPVVLFSANKNVNKEYKNWKAEAFIPKPFDTQLLIDTVEKVISD